MAKGKHNQQIWEFVECSSQPIDHMLMFNFEDRKSDPFISYLKKKVLVPIHNDFSFSLKIGGKQRQEIIVTLKGSNTCIKRDLKSNFQINTLPLSVKLGSVTRGSEEVNIRSHRNTPASIESNSGPLLILCFRFQTNT